MPTQHCRECNPGTPCGDSHVYVIQFFPEVANEYGSNLSYVRSVRESEYNGYLYVGGTTKSVECRFMDNYRRCDGTVVSIKDVKSIGEDGQWKSDSKNTKRIRRYYQQHRPDLLYFDVNPIKVPANDRGRLERREIRLVQKLTNIGWHVEGPRRDD